MGIVLFLKLIGTTILKYAAAKLGLKIIGMAIEVYSTFDYLYSISTCKDLNIIGLQVGYDILSNKAIHYLTSKVKEDRYEIQRLKSGLYIAKSSIVKHNIFLESYSQFESMAPKEFAATKIYHKSEHIIQVGDSISLLKDHRPMISKSGSKIIKTTDSTHIKDHRKMKIRKGK